MSAPILLGARILIALALYAFLGWALYLSWRALRSQADLLAAQKVPMLNITVTPPDGQPQTLSLQKADILIGREADCDLRPEDTAVSARHTRTMQTISPTAPSTAFSFFVLSHNRTVRPPCSHMNTPFNHLTRTYLARAFKGFKSFHCNPIRIFPLERSTKASKLFLFNPKGVVHI